MASPPWTLATTTLPRRVAVLAMLVAAPVAACATAPAHAHTGPDSFAPIVRRVLPSVVNIAVTEAIASSDDPLANQPLALQRQYRDQLRHREMQRAGSGFIVDAAGRVVTNNHVVAGADRIVVTLSDGTDLAAIVVGVDELTDVASLRVHADHALPYVAFGGSRGDEVGDWVVAAGNPSASAARSPRASSRPAAATSARNRSTTSSRSTRRSIPAIPAARCSTKAGRWLA